MSELQEARWEVTLRDEFREESHRQIIKVPISHMYHVGLLDIVKNQLRQKF